MRYKSTGEDAIGTGISSRAESQAERERQRLNSCRPNWGVEGDEKKNDEDKEEAVEEWRR